jgi:hypothetical protein
MTEQCPKPGKRKFTTQKAAIAAAITSSSKYASGMRTYRCVCGAWHLTHKLPRWSTARRGA